jgi:hypothetical protein
VENRGFEALETPPKHQNHELHKVLFIGKIKMCYQVRCVFDRRPACVRSYAVRSVAGASPCNVCSIVGAAFNRTYCN